YSTCVVDLDITTTVVDGEAVANGTDFAVFEVTVKNAAGDPLPGLEVEPIKIGDFHATLEPRSAVTDEHGVAQFQASSLYVETAKYKINLASADTSVEVEVHMVPDLATAEIKETYVVQNGSFPGNVNIVRVQVKDQYNNPVEGVDVDWHLQDEPHAYFTESSTSEATTTTDEDGYALVSMAMPTDETTDTAITSATYTNINSVTSNSRDINTVIRPRIFKDPDYPELVSWSNPPAAQDPSIVSGFDGYDVVESDTIEGLRYQTALRGATRDQWEAYCASLPADEYGRIWELPNSGMLSSLRNRHKNLLGITLPDSVMVPTVYRGIGTTYPAGNAVHNPATDSAGLYGNSYESAPMCVASWRNWRGTDGTRHFFPYGDIASRGGIYDHADYMQAQGDYMGIAAREGYFLNEIGVVLSVKESKDHNTVDIAAQWARDCTNESEQDLSRNTYGWRVLSDLTSPTLITNATIYSSIRALDHLVTTLPTMEALQRTPYAIAAGPHATMNHKQTIGWDSEDQSLQVTVSQLDDAGSHTLTAFGTSYMTILKNQVTRSGDWKFAVAESSETPYEDYSWKESPIIDSAKDLSVSIEKSYDFSRHTVMFCSEPAP
ncbi:hypothetical protein CGI23_25410, partial [Vibrio parahaemolyticus]|uniref:Ig-like domain-containing protein n=1 Tax=Vibrio parahaemolyticus TaxID=670 RepID=UPI001174E5F4